MFSQPRTLKLRAAGNWLMNPLVSVLRIKQTYIICKTYKYIYIFIRIAGGWGGGGSAAPSSRISPRDPFYMYYIIARHIKDMSGSNCARANIYNTYKTYYLYINNSKLSGSDPTKLLSSQRQLASVLHIIQTYIIYKTYKYIYIFIRQVGMGGGGGGRVRRRGAIKKTFPPDKK